jgi:adenine deaminase
MEQVENALLQIGIKHRRPFLLLSLLSLTVSPYYKFSDKGVVDTESRALLPPVFVKE